MSSPMLHVVVPGDIDTRTGGYGYDRRIVSGLRTRGWQVIVVSLPGGYPMPSNDERALAIEAFRQIPDDALVLVDGLAFGALPMETAHEGRRLRLVALVHHPLALETGLDAATASMLQESEARALRGARAVIVTSAGTVAAVKALRPDAPVAVVEPGTDPAPLAHGSRDGTLQLLSVGSIVPRKGHDTLIDALARLVSSSWRLLCAGSLDRNPAFAASVMESCATGGLRGRVQFPGDLEGGSLTDAYDTADLFVLPTRYEGYGMAVAEALARGIPVVSTPTGAIGELVGDDAGVLVPADAPEALAAVIRQLLEHRGELDRVREGARRRRLTLPTWEAACARMEDVLSSLVLP